MARFKKASNIKVGVVGYGGAFNMGKKHLFEMQAAGMTPVAVAEIAQDRLQVAAEDFPGIETYDSVKAMLKSSDVNLIVIITPHNTHATLALQCLKAGRHVVCEKPLAITTAECDRMIAAAEKQDLVLSTYHNRHWDGCILQAVETIKKKQKIGEVFRIDCTMAGYSQPRDWWRSSKSISGGILYDWGVHLLEYALQIMDDEIVEVSGFAHKNYWAAKTKWKDDSNEDEAMAVVRFKRGGWLTLCISQLKALPAGGMVDFHGTKGGYRMEQGRYQLITPQKRAVLTKEGRNPPGKGETFYQNIAGHLAQGKDLIITAEWSRRPIHILDLACKSAERGQAMKAKHK